MRIEIRTVYIYWSRKEKERKFFKSNCFTYFTHVLHSLHSFHTLYSSGGRLFFTYRRYFKSKENFVLDITYFALTTIIVKCVRGNELHYLSNYI